MCSSESVVSGVGSSQSNVCVCVYVYVCVCVSADKAYREMKTLSTSQSIVVSGKLPC